VAEAYSTRQVLDVDPFCPERRSRSPRAGTNLVIAFASPSSPHDKASPVAQRRPMLVDPKGAGTTDVVVATQTYIAKEWWSQVTAFDAKSGAIAWQSERVAVPYARGFRICRFGALVVLSDEKGSVSALRAMDGQVAWRASVGGEVASCCATESLLVSGQPGDLVLTTVKGDSFVVDPSGARRTARPASCGALPSDCRTCPGGSADDSKDEGPRGVGASSAQLHCLSRFGAIATSRASR
jgi:hypothetical protein